MPTGINILFTTIPDHTAIAWKILLLTEITKRSVNEIRIMHVPKYRDLLPSADNILPVIFPFTIIPKYMPQANSNIRPKKVESKVKI